MPAKDQRLLRVGVLGCGPIAQAAHFESCTKARNATLYAICDVADDLRDRMAATHAPTRSYADYDAMLADPDLEAVVIATSDAFHGPAALRALQAGKHVLCEKPIGMTAEEAQTLIAARDASGKLVAEAFMVRYHPQWRRAREIVGSGQLGDVRAIQTLFSYYNVDPSNVRNQADIGGGGLLDIGCYAVATARYIFSGEPHAVIGLIERDPAFGTDRLASGLAAFSDGRQLAFTCSTQLVPYQRVQILGTKGRLEIEIPFNAPPGYGCSLLLDTGADLKGGGITRETVAECDQYTLQGDAFSRMILGDEPQEFGLEDAISNMRVLDALTRSAHSSRWERP